MTIALADLLRPSRIILRLKAPDKARLLSELARRAEPELGRSAAELAALLAGREALGSTGVGAGIAVPHARVEGLPAPIGFFARLDKPLEWTAIDGRPVDLVFLLFSPPQEPTSANGQPDSHLAALAAVSRRLRSRPVSDALRKSDDPTQVQALLIGDD